MGLNPRPGADPHSAGGTERTPPSSYVPSTRLARAMMDEVVGTALQHASTAPARQTIVIEGLLS